MPVAPTRTVTYQFSCSTAKNLDIPYAIAVDGRALPQFATQPGRVDCSREKIQLKVQQGRRVSLYLNSDAHPSFRQSPVYAVTVGERDVLVTITEKTGRHNDPDTPTIAQQTDTLDKYTAPLTGNIWMRISHRYTADEVASRLPDGTSAAVAAAVTSIYRGLSAATLTINEPATTTQPARRLVVNFRSENNPSSNITNFNHLSDGLPRAHPAGYAALFSAALDVGIASLTMSSCWRPMLGSIAHRAGLGLDVAVLGGTVLNREELRQAMKKMGAEQGIGNKNDKDLVSEAEITAFAAYEKSMAAQKAADDELDTAIAKKREISRKLPKNEEAIKQAAKAEADAKERAKNAAKNANEELKKWTAARDANEPDHVHRYRAALLQCRCVRQLFDPWVMDDNTRDNKAPSSNIQKTDSETNHAHHLHITVSDANILP
ncbi:hypothetical protein ACG0Z6_02430 [Roseateles sp. BYS180W]|uniref:Uncharacterized protein n=1 Tax=Roseateles rivi TaxID=3299028 RepID=A0ABW7FRY2_9BURK